VQPHFKHSHTSLVLHPSSGLFHAHAWERCRLKNQLPWGGGSSKISNAIGVVGVRSARETFTRCELAAAYKEFAEHGLQHQDEKTGLSVSAYRFGERVLLVYEESEAGVVVLTSPKCLQRSP